MAAQRGPAAVQHADPQVRQRNRRVGQVVPAAVEAEERVLHDVFGGATVAHDDDRHADKAERVFGVQGRYRGCRTR